MKLQRRQLEFGLAHDVLQPDEISRRLKRIEFADYDHFQIILQLPNILASR